MEKVTQEVEKVTQEVEKVTQEVEKVTQEIELGTLEISREVSKVVRMLNGRPDPDLEQEAFLGVLRAFRRPGSVRHPRALIRKIARDTVIDHWRLQQRHRWDSIESVPDRFITGGSTQEAELERDRTIEMLRGAILRLGCDIRGPVYLFYLEGYSIKTIARIYGKSTSAVKMALHRGRRRVAEIIHATATIVRTDHDFPD